jgi:hypothetical protein
VDREDVHRMGGPFTLHFIAITQIGKKVMFPL